MLLRAQGQAGACPGTVRVIQCCSAPHGRAAGGGGVGVWGVWTNACDIVSAIYIQC